MAWATLEQAQRHLRLEVTGQSSPMTEAETDLALKLAQAEAVIRNYLDRGDATWTAEMDTWTAETPTSDQTTVPGVVQAAVLLQVGELYRFRGDDVAGAMPDREHGYLHPAIVALLARYRDPALA